MDSVETVVITSFHLPVQVTRDSTGSWNVQVNKATTLSTLFQLRSRYPVRVMFVGWPGIHIQDYAQQQEVRHMLLDVDCIPVFPPPDEFSLYLEFCTTFLWPACHNVVRSFQGDNPVPFNQEQWAAYQVVNQRYADVVVSNVREPSDLIWVHDYHLFLTPMNITRKLRKANIGFFLHSPFPSSEIFRCLPVREELLKGMLCADLIGFHFWEYARHFLTCCRRILGLEFEFKRGGFIGVDYCSREVRVRVGHTCLQFDFTMAKIREPQVTARSLELAQSYSSGKRFMFVGIDRCDRLSGLKLKLLAYKTFLERCSPETRQGVVLVQYVYPALLQTESEQSRIISDLEKVTRSIAEEFGSGVIDLKFGDVDHATKFGLLRLADALIDTSLKDGLNLVPFEYIAARLSNEAKDGIVIISEFTGCSRVLVGAVKVNPWNTERVVDSLEQAMQMVDLEKSRHFGPDANYVASHSLLQWASDFISDVRASRKKDEMVYVAFGFGANTRLMGIDQNFGKLDPYDVANACMKSTGLRLFLLDNEGTLANSAYGNQLRDQGNPPSEAVLSLLRSLTKDPRNVVVITTGRQRELVEAWFGSVPNIGYAAEHGFHYKVPAVWGDVWRDMLPPGCESTLDMSWTSIAYQLMELYQKRVQNTYIHFKGSAMVWQYREADPELGAWQARELSSALEETLSSHHVIVSTGKGYVEVKVKGVNKGVVAKAILTELERKFKHKPDFVLCIGDDRSDELMFEAVNQVYLEESIAPPSPELNRARSGLSFSDLTMCAPGVDARKASLRRSPSMSRPTCADDTLGAMDARGKSAATQPVFTCTVGKKPSKAKYYLDDPEEVSEVLTRIIEKNSC